MASVLLAISPLAAAECSPSGLAGWWRGDGHAADLLGTAHGSAGSGVLFVPGKVGKAFQFADAPDSYVSLPNAPVFQPSGNALTIECWFKPNFRILGDKLDTIFSKRDGCGTISYHFGMGRGHLGRVGNLYFSVGGVGHWSTNTVPNDGQYHHVAVTFDANAASNHCRIYIDGQLAGGGDMAVTLPVTGSGPVIGKHGECGYYSTAAIDELAFYGRSLTDVEIGTIVQAGVNGKCADGYAPSIAVQPQAQSVAAGADVAFSVVAAGSPVLSYQWLSNGVSISGGTNSVFRLPAVSISAAADYTVYVTNRWGAVLSATAALSVAPVQHFTLTVGDTVSQDVIGSVATPGAGYVETQLAEDIYTFAGTNGQRIYFEDKGNYNTYWVLTAPNGAQLFRDNHDYGHPGAISLPVNGNYEIRVRGHGNPWNVGWYAFRLWAVPGAQTFALGVQTNEAGARFLPVSNGVPTDGAGNLETLGAEDIYTFSGTAGQRLYFDDQSGWFGAFWELITPDSVVLMRDNLDSSDPGLITLPSTGTYTIRVRGYGAPTHFGTYAFNVWEVPVQSPFSIAIGDAISDGSIQRGGPSQVVQPLPGAGRISAPGEMDEYAFAAAAGQKAFFDDQGWGNGYWALYDPSGTQLFRDTMDGGDPGVFTFRTNGTYTIRVFGYGQSYHIGAYAFRIAAVTNASVFAINIGDEVYDGYISTPPASLLTPADGAGRISIPGEEDRYTFTGSAGQRVFFDDITGSFGCTWQVTDPAGVVLMRDGMGGGDPGVITLTRSGLYTIAVWGHGQAHNVGTYGFRLWAVTNQQFNIAIDETVADGAPSAGAGRIETPGGEDNYTFTGTAGHQLYFDDLGGANGFYGYWHVLDPDGVQIFRDHLDHSDPGPITLARSGAYTIKVRTWGDASHIGTYSFRVGSVPVAPAPYVIAVGDSVSNNVPASGAGVISLPGEEDVFAFAGTAGQRVFFDDQTGWFGVFWVLADPNGVQLFRDNLDNSDPGVFTLPVSGTYTIRVRAANNQSTGTYVFKLWAVPPTQSYAIAIGTNVSIGVPAAGAGTIETPGSEDVYTFTAVAGQSIFFDDQGNHQQHWTLLDPRGHVLFRDNLDYGDPGNITMPLSGTYTIRVRGHGQDYQTGPYAFALTDNGTNAVPANLLETFAIQIGDTISDATIQRSNVSTNIPAAGAGNIEVVGAHDLYTFTASPGQGVYFKVLNGSSASYWQLYDEGGNIVFSEYMPYDNVGRRNLSRGGTYYLLVFPNGGNTGVYSFKLWDTADNRFQIAFDDVISNGAIQRANETTNQVLAGAGNIEFPGAYDIYTFYSASNQVVYFEDLGAERCCLDWAVYDPLNNRILADRLDGGDPGRYGLREGTYLIYVYPAWNDPNFVGGYSFAVRRVNDQRFQIAIGDTVTNNAVQRFTDSTIQPLPGAGTIDRAGEYDVYTFQSATNQVVYFEDLNADRCCINWQLYDPNGNEVFNDRLDEWDPGRIGLFAGTYTLYVFPAGADASWTGNYRFRLRPSPVEYFEIAIGDAVSDSTVQRFNSTNSQVAGAGRIEVPGGYDVYTFTSHSNQVVFIEDNGAPCCIDWSLYDSYGNRIFYDRLDGNDPGRIGLGTGLYTLYVHPAGNDPTWTGAYHFRITPVTDDRIELMPGAVIGSGGSTLGGAGRLEGAGSYDIYTLTSSSNQVLYFDDMGADQCCLTWQLVDPYGNSIFNDSMDNGDPGRIGLGVGTYTMYVYPAGAVASYYGTYRFRILPAVDQRFQIAIGDTVSNGAIQPSTTTHVAGAGNIEGPGVYDIYTFTSTSNQTVFLEDLGAQQCCIDWQMYDASGNRLFYDRLDGSDPGRFSLGIGTYTIYVNPAGNDPNWTGTYQFRLRSVVDERFELALGQTVRDGVPNAQAGRLASPGQYDIFTFNVAPGELVYFQDLNAGCCIDWAVYDPSGNLVFADRLDGYSPGARVLARGGLHTLYVYPAGAAAEWTNSYSFRVWSALPYIVQQPASQRGAVGQRQVFNVTAETAFGALAYQWRFNGADLPGETAPILTLASPTLSQAGNYDVVIFNPYGAVTSSVATLTIDASQLYVSAFSPSGVTPSDVSQLSITFNEPIVASTFTGEDISILTPTGLLNTATLNIVQVDGQRFNVQLPSLTASGAYTVNIGPAITNTSGRPMTGGIFVPLYANDFETAAGAEWSRTDITTNDVTTRFLGMFGNDVAALTLAALPPHSRLRLSYDLMIIDSWDGGADLFGFNIAGQSQPAWEHSFKNFDYYWPQSYPGLPEIGGSNFISYHGYPDSIYRSLQLDFAHTNDLLAIEFYGRNLEALWNESWGLDNLRLSALVPENGVFSGRFVIDKAPPAIVGISPSGTNREPVSAIEITFDAPIQAPTLSIEDLQLSGPAGPINITSLQRLSPVAFRLTFEPQRINGTYSLLTGPFVQDLAGNAMSVPSSNAFFIYVPPLITGHPQSQTVVRNNTVTFNVGVLATNPRYQWFHGAMPIPQGTNATLTLVNVQTNQAGQYSVVVTDEGGSSTSAAAALTVNYSYGSLIAAGHAAPAGLPPIGGDGVHIDLFNGIGGGVPTPAQLAGVTPSGVTLSPTIDFPRPGQTISVGNSFITFFADTATPPDQVLGLQALNFILRHEFYLRVSRDLDRHPETPEIDLQLGVGSDDGFYLTVASNYLGSAGDRGFSYSWMEASFENEGLYPVTLLYAANASGASGLEFAWYVTTNNISEVVPQRALYISPNPADRLITFEEVPSGTVLSNQFETNGIRFTTVAGELSTTAAFPGKFVPVSPVHVYGDSRSNPAETGILEFTFTVPGTNVPATTTYLNFYVIDAETNGASVAVFDSDGALIFTNVYRGGGGAQEQVSVSHPRIARARVTLGQGTDTAAIDNIRYSTPLPINHRPEVATLMDRTVDEGQTISFTATATDSDEGQVVTFSLVGPAGATINPASGAFTWTPSEAQGPGTYTVVVQATDNAFFPLTGSNAFTVTVREVNAGPSLNPIADQLTAAGRTLQFTAVAQDADLPVQSLVFSLEGAPQGMTIDAASGVATWNVPAGTPDGTNVVTVRVTDSGALSATRNVRVVVDSAGPRVLAFSPSGFVSNSVSSFELSFSKPINGSSFTPGDVIISGPAAPPISYIEFLGVTGWRLHLVSPLSLGQYTVTVGPNITDAAGNAMNQDGDGINGEPSDSFTGSFTIALPDLAILRVAAPAIAQPGEQIPLSWVVTNIGNAAVTSVFSQTIYLTPTNRVGHEHQLAVFFHTNALMAGGATTVTQLVTIPSSGRAGALRLAVEADSGRLVGESDEGNNIAFATNDTFVPQVLTLQVSASSIREDATPGTVFATLTRNGNSSLPLPVTLTSSDPAELSAPTTVTIPGSQQSAGFYLTVHPDAFVDGNKLVTITATATGFNVSTAAVTVIDANVPSLQLSLSASSVAEGQSVIATLTRDHVTTNAVEVQVVTSSPTQASTPTTVIFAPGQGTTNFLVMVPDDNLIQGARSFSVSATAHGFRSATAALSVTDNDMPSVELTLASTNISEGAGPQATIATVRRSPITARALILELESTNRAAALVPAQITIPAGSDVASFPIAAVDNDVVDGPKQTLLRCFITDSVTGVRLGEAAPVLLVVSDDDGPTLKLTLANKLVAEGLEAATIATVTRNTDTNGALVVTLASGNTNEALVPASVTIPAGATSVVFVVSSVNDGVTDGNQTATITASATDFTSGSDTLTVSDANLPDLIVANVSVPAAGVTETYANVTFRIHNQGLIPAASNISTRVFISTDPVIGNDVLAGQYNFVGSVSPGLSFEQTVGVRLPRAAADYWIVAITDVNNAIRETLEENNAFVSVSPIRVRAAYEATVATSVDVAPAGTPIPLSGRALIPGTSTPPPVSSLVNIHIYVRGTHRVISALTDADGYFDMVWRPLSGEAGAYQVGAAHPGSAEAPAQDSFNLLGMRSSPSESAFTMSEQGSVTNVISIQNLSPIPLTGLSAEVVSKPANVEIVLSAPGSIAGDQAANLVYSLTALDASTPHATVHLRVGVAQGLTNDVYLYVTIEPLRPRLVVLPDVVRSGMKRGVQTFVEFSVANTGGSNTGPLTILAPNVPWLGIVSTNPLPSLAPGQTNRVTLRLLPSATLPLGEYPGTIVVSDGASFANVPFSFRALSDARGDLLVTVADEYTYYAAGSPNVSNATVMVRDAVSGVIVTNGVTDSSGTLFVPQITEGYYEIQVDADKHSTYRDTKLFVAGITNNLTAFISRQMVQYRWTVEPTTVEDRTRITIETTFETVVPAPVVTLEPALIDLSTITGNEAQIDLRIANHGLIAAENFQLRFDSHPDWELTPLISEVGTLAARSELTVPLTIRRITTASAAKNAASTGSASPKSSKNGSSCTIGGGGFWELVCGEKKNYSAPITVVNAGSGCGGTPGLPPVGTAPYGGGFGGVGGGGFGVPTAPFSASPSFSPPTVCDCDTIPKVCLAGSLSFDLDGMAKKLADMVLSKLPSARVIKNEVKLSLSGQICTCCKDNSISYEGNVTGTASLDLKVALGLGAAGEMEFEAGPEWSDVSASFNANLGVELSMSGSVSVSYTRECGGGEKLCVNGSATLGAFAGAHIEGEISAKNNYDNVTYTGSADGALGLQGTLTASVKGCSDGNMEFKVCGQVTAVAHLTGTVKAEIAGNEVEKTIGPNGDTELASAGQCGGDAGLKIANADSGRSALPRRAKNADTNLVELVPGNQFLRPPQEVLSALLGNEQQKPAGVCAVVRIKLSQDAVLARDAFKATLELDNESGTTLQNIRVDVVVKNADGQVVTNMFGLRPPTVSGLTGVDGSGSLGVGGSGTAQWILLPTVDAAPTTPLQYFVGGTLHYVQDGLPVSVPLAAAPITVYPLPQLALDYFHQRDVYADDPFTDAVEPSMPYNLAVLARNTGYGVAKSFRITSAQPEIVDNERGLLIDFKIIATEVSGVGMTPSLTADFGDIQPGQGKVARWLMTSTLQGLFTDYKASFENLDIMGNPRLAIVTNVAIHEMVHLVHATGAGDDGKPDFLVNEVQDPPLDIADTIYFSDGSKALVALTTNVTVTGTLSPGNLSVTITAPSAEGWTYFRIADPGNGQYVLRRAVRSDGVEILFGTNVWTTDRTFVGMGQRPLPEHLIHLLDLETTGSYTLYYGAPPAPDAVAPSSAVAALPAASYESFALHWSGNDDAGGSGVAYYDIYVSTNGGPYGVWLRRTTLSGAIFNGTLGSQYAFYSVVTDNAGNREQDAAAPDTETAVSRVNAAPEFGSALSFTVAEGSTLVADVPATDTDGNAVTYSLLGAPAGVQIDPTTGRITWLTSEANGPSTNQFQVRALDNGVPPLMATNTVTVVVTEINSAPALAPVAAVTVNEGRLVTITNQVTDIDLPTQSLTFSFGSTPPAGAALDAVTGLFTWQPNETQGPSTNTISIVVADSGTPSLSATQVFLVVVRDVISDFTLSLGSTNLLAGESNSIPIVIRSSLDLRNVQFTLDLPVARLSNAILAATSPEVQLIQVVPLGESGASIMRYAVSLDIDPGVGSGSRELARIGFIATSNGPSAIVPLNASELVVRRSDQSLVQNGLAFNGRVVIVVNEPVLITERGAVPVIRLYGKPGATYSLQQSSDISGGWQQVTNVTLTPPLKSVQWTNDGGAVRFYRSRQE